MTDPANKHLRAVMSAEWAREMKPRIKSTQAKMAKMARRSLQIAAGFLLWLALAYCVGFAIDYLGAALWRGITDAEASIEVGPEDAK